MLYHFLYPLRDWWFGFNVFKYITFRASLASITAFLASVLLGRYIIAALVRLGIRENLRREYVESLYQIQKHKTGTPTMGGIIIVLSIALSTLLWARLDNRFIHISLLSLVWLGLVGFVDDYIKLIRKSAGIQATTKLLGQTVLAVLVGLYLYGDPDISQALYVPFIKNAVMNLGIVYIFFVILVIVGASNAVNVTDGLDGLAVGCVSMVALAYCALCYITGNAGFSSYLNVYYLPGSGELTVFCAALAGGAMGFLWYNSYPASIFMGDTGSLALGGAIGVVSVLIKKELLLLMAGGVFAVETISIMLQVASFKLRKKRIFLMSPLHHHFQLKGWHESKVTIRFWILGVICALLTLASLKLQ